MASHVQKALGQSQQRAQWAACDPMTLVAAAKDSLYTQIPQQQRQPEVVGPLEEVIARFEQQTRVAQGVSPIGIGTTQQQQEYLQQFTQ